MRKMFAEKSRLSDSLSFRDDGSAVLKGMSMARPATTYQAPPPFSPSPAPAAGKGTPLNEIDAGLKKKKTEGFMSSA